MIAVKGYFDGEKIHLLESIPTPVKPSEVTIWFSEDAAQRKAISAQARKKLRGSAKGLRLWERLAADRQAEKNYES